MENKKVIHVALGKVNPNRLNGVNKVVHGLASAQKEIGDSIEFWGITRTPNDPHDERSFKTRLYKDLGKFWLSSTLKRDIRKAADGTIFHLHGAFNTQIALLALYFRKNRIPYVFTPHGAYNTRAMQKNYVWKKLYCWLIESSLVKHAECVHILGLSEGIGLSKLFRYKRVLLIPNGHCFSNEKPRLADSRNISLTIGFLGRLEIETKGLDIFCAALSLATENGFDILWEITGDGEQKEALKELIDQYGINESVRFNGAMFGEQKRQFLRRIDFLCLNSRNEGLPGVIFESMEQGTPVIVSHATNFGNYITQHKCGLVLNANTPNDLFDIFKRAKALKEAPDAYRELSHNSIETLNTHFNWSHIANRMRDLYSF